MKIKLYLVSCLTLIMSLAGSVMAFAVENTAVTTAMTTIQTDITDTINAVAPVAILIFGVFLAWRYGKRIFNSVAK